MTHSICRLGFPAAAALAFSLVGATILWAQSKAPPAEVPSPRKAPEAEAPPSAKPKPNLSEKPSFTEKDVARAKPRTPLEAALQGGIPANAVKRAQVRENLYALLATAENEKAAKRTRAALDRLYLTSGSPTVDLLVRRAIKAIKAKNYPQATEFLDAVTELAPDYAEGWNRRAYALYKQNDLRRAAGDLRRVLALDPNHFRALDGLGTILVEIGNEAGALKVYERLVGVHPNWSKAEKAYKELKRKVEGRGI